MKKRNREKTEEKIIAAVGTVLAESGFHKLGINAVARAAGVDKVLIYRYFGGLEGLLRVYGEKGDFWPTDEELLGGEPGELRKMKASDALGTALINFLEALRKRPLTLEILAWESVEQNQLADLLSNMREDQGERLLTVFNEMFPETSIDTPAFVTLMTTAITYLILRSRHVDAYNTIPLNNDDGWQRLKAMIKYICDRCL